MFHLPGLKLNQHADDDDADDDDDAAISEQLATNTGKQPFVAHDFVQLLLATMLCFLRWRPPTATTRIITSKMTMASTPF
jgi:hypothetical protein